MSFIYIIKHNLKGRPIFVKDLGPDGWQSMPPKNFANEIEKMRMLHHSFTEEQVKNSKGLAQALACGWFKEVEIKFSSDGPDGETVAALKNELSDLKSLLTQLVMQQSTPQVFAQPLLESPANSSIDNDLLNKIAKDLKDIRTKTIGVEIAGYKELSAEDVAIQAREKMPTNFIKDNSVEIKTTNIDINMDDLLDNLGDLD